LAKSARIIPLDQKADYVVCFGFQGTAAPGGDDGPVQIRRVKPNESVKLVCNPDYWKSEWPYLDGIVAKTVLGLGDRTGQQGGRLAYRAIIGVGRALLDQRTASETRLRAGLTRRQKFHIRHRLPPVGNEGF
jgi:hypothetical protein